MSGDAHLAEHGKWTRRAALASVSVALVLLVLKTLAVWRTGSVAVLGSLADTGLDLVASLVTLWGVRVAATPADAQHRFGHGKAEALAALFQVSLIGIAAVALAAESFRRIGVAHETRAPELGIGVSLVAIVLSLGLILYQRRIIARTGSLAIGTDNLHYQSDFFLNGSVILALVLDNMLGIAGADIAFGFGIAAWLGWGAWRSAIGALDHLMDKEWPLEERERLVAIVDAHPQVEGLHDLRTRTSGAHRFGQFHIWVDPGMTVRQVHDVMDEIEAELALAFPDVEFIIHPDPAGHIETHHAPIAQRAAGEVIADEAGEARAAT